VLATADVAIQPDDTIDTFAQRVHAAEHQLVVATIAHLCGSSPTPPLPAIAPPAVKEIHA
jgi:folate-dependent phosphoribosylglycinamide formyltransferase PurN